MKNFRLVPNVERAFQNTCGLALQIKNSPSYPRGKLHGEYFFVQSCKVVKILCGGVRYGSRAFYRGISFGIRDSQTNPIAGMGRRLCTLHIGTADNSRCGTDCSYSCRSMDSQGIRELKNFRLVLNAERIIDKKIRQVTCEVITSAEIFLYNRLGLPKKF